MLEITRTRVRSAAVAAGILGAPLLAAAHHGWSSYDSERRLQLEGTVRASAYENPHGSIELETSSKTWHVVLAPPARMKSRGLNREQLKPGTQVAVDGHPHRDKESELRAERITVSGKTVELR